MRLDLFLKSSRLAPRRSLAQDLIKAGRVRVNDAKGKPGREVKEGDLIEIRRHSGTLVVKVREIPDRKQFSKKEAPDLYEIVSEAQPEENEFPF